MFEEVFADDFGGFVQEDNGGDDGGLQFVLVGDVLDELVDVELSVLQFKG